VKTSLENVEEVAPVCDLPVASSEDVSTPAQALVSDSPDSSVQALVETAASLPPEPSNDELSEAIAMAGFPKAREPARDIIRFQHAKLNTPLANWGAWWLFFPWGEVYRTHEAMIPYRVAWDVLMRPKPHGPPIDRKKNVINLGPLVHGLLLTRKDLWLDEQSHLKVDWLFKRMPLLIDLGKSFLSFAVRGRPFNASAPPPLQTWFGQIFTDCYKDPAKIGVTILERPASEQANINAILTRLKSETGLKDGYVISSDQLSEAESSDIIGKVNKMGVWPTERPGFTFAKWLTTFGNKQRAKATPRAQESAELAERQQYNAAIDLGRLRATGNLLQLMGVTEDFVREGEFDKAAAEDMVMRQEDIQREMTARKKAHNQKRRAKNKKKIMEAYLKEHPEYKKGEMDAREFFAHGAKPDTPVQRVEAQARKWQREKKEKQRAEQEAASAQLLMNPKVSDGNVGHASSTEPDENLDVPLPSIFSPSSRIAHTHLPEYNLDPIEVAVPEDAPDDYRRCPPLDTIPEHPAVINGWLCVRNLAGTWPVALPYDPGNWVHRVIVREFNIRFLTVPVPQEDQGLFPPYTSDENEPVEHYFGVPPLRDDKAKLAPLIDLGTEMILLHLPMEHTQINFRRWSKLPSKEQVCNLQYLNGPPPTYDERPPEEPAMSAMSTWMMTPFGLAPTCVFDSDHPRYKYNKMLVQRMKVPRAYGQLRNFLLLCSCYLSYWQWIEAESYRLYYEENGRYGRKPQKWLGENDAVAGYTLAQQFYTDRHLWKWNFVETRWQTPPFTWQCNPIEVYRRQLLVMRLMMLLIRWDLRQP